MEGRAGKRWVSGWTDGEARAEETVQRVKGQTDGEGEPSVPTEKGLPKATSDVLLFSSQTMMGDQGLAEGADLF